MPLSEPAQMTLPRVVRRYGSAYLVIKNAERVL
jgi:hypothetical protein